MTDRLRRWALPTIILLTLAAAGVSIVNGFTYDDRYIVELNPAVRGPMHWWRAFRMSYWPADWGGDGYRPLTILGFRLQAAIGHGSPLPFHAVNVLLYVLVAVFVFMLARELLPPGAAWLAAALFAVHPVHVEAVANVVGQSELLVAAALLPAIILYIRDRRRGPLTLRTGIVIGALYVFACFAKEHGVVLPALLVAAELTVIDDGTRFVERLRRPNFRIVFLALAAIALAFIAMRAVVLADHGIGGFQPFTPFNSLHIGTRDRILTAVGVVPEWVRLFYWPAHLSSEYGPPDIEIAQGFSIAQLPGALLLVAVLAFGVLLRRRRPVISFAIAIVVIALLPSSNFLVPAGIVLAERTLFLPSVGAMLIVGAVAVDAARELARRYGAAREQRVRRVAYAGAALLLAAGIGRSAMRSRVWHDNERLFTQAVIDSPRSYRAHYMLGAWHFENKRKREGEAEYRRALSLFPYDPFLSYNMAEQYRAVGLCGPALPLYRWTFGLDANFPLGRGHFAWCLLNEGRYDEARTRAFETMGVGGDIAGMRRVIFITDSVRAAERGIVKHSPLADAGAPSKLPESMQKAATQASVPRGD